MLCKSVPTMPLSLVFDGLDIFLVNISNIFSSVEAFKQDTISNAFCCGPLGPASTFTFNRVLILLLALYLRHLGNRDHEIR